MSDTTYSRSTTCPSCGSLLSHTTGGLCLTCLGREALRADDLASDGAGGTPFGSAAGAMTDVPAAIDVPARIGGYTLIEEIGRGGMGIVYAARHERLGHVVALKLIHASSPASIELRTRFIREAQTHAGLRHPHIVRVHDAGQDQGFLFFTMDLVTDGDLAGYLRRGLLQPRSAAALVAKVARAVAHAHSTGVLHRDLKPSNILLDGDEPRVADFGLAAQLEPGGDLTLGTRVLGTPAYLAPEVHDRGSAAASVASDIYALGALLHEMLTGRPPITAPATGGSRAADIIAPGRLARDVPRDLETIVLKCLEHAPEARYALAADLADDLEAFLDHRPIKARPIAAITRFGRWCRRRPTLAALWFLALALAAGGTGSAIMIAQAREETREQLRVARLAEAQALSLTRTAGRRDAALRAVAASASVRPSLEARNAAIRALALTDVRLVQSWPIASSSVITASFSADGTSMVVRSGSDLFWREVGTDREIARLEHDAAQPQRGLLGIPAIAPDGNAVLMHGTGDVIVRFRRDGTTATRDVVLTGRAFPWPRPIFPYGGDIVFSPDGRRFTVALSEGGFSVHDAADAREIGRWTSEHPVNRVRWSPDGTRIAAASMRREAGGKVHLIDSHSLETLQTLQLAGNVHSIEWSPTGTYLAGSSESLELRVFRADTGALLQSLPTRGAYLARLAFIGDEATLVSASLEPVLRWRSRRTGEEFLHLEGVETAGLHAKPDGMEFITTNGRNQGLIYRAELPTGLVRTPVDADDFVKSSAGTGSVVFHPDGRLVAATCQGVTTIFSTESGSALAQFRSKSRREEVTAQFSADGSALLVCGTVDGLLRVPVIPRENGITLGDAEILEGLNNHYLRDLSDDGRRLALVAPRAGRVRILEIDASAALNAVLADWSCPGAYGAAFGPGGREVLINHDDSVQGAQSETLRVWDAATGKVLRSLEAPVSAEVAWNERHGIVLTSNGPELSLLWRTENWSRGPDIPQPARGNFTSFDIAPDGRMAAIASGAGVHLIATDTGETFALLNAGEPFGFANATAFSPDGTTLAAVNGDGLLHVWRLAELRAALAKLGLDW